MCQTSKRGTRPWRAALDYQRTLSAHQHTPGQTLIVPFYATAAPFVPPVARRCFGCSFFACGSQFTAHSSLLTAYCSCSLLTVHRPHDVRWWRTGKASADLSIFPLARARVRPPLRTTTFSSSTAPPLAGAVQALRHGKVGIMISIRCRAVAPPVMSVPYQWNPGPLGKKMSHAKTQSRKGKKRQRKTWRPGDFA